jgi:hypothetical protein
MWVTYRPDDQDEQEWWLHLDDIGDAEAEMIEARAGMDWEEWKARLIKGSTKARRALLWALLRRQHLALRYEDVHFSSRTLLVEFDAQEYGQMIQAIEKRTSKRAPTDEERTSLDVLRAELETARPAERGKAPAGSDA